MQVTPHSSPHCSSCVFNIEKLQTFCDENSIELKFTTAPVAVFYAVVGERKYLFVNFEIRPHRSLEIAFEKVGIPLALMSNVSF